MKQFEGDPVGTRKCFRAAADIFARLVWDHPLAGLSVSDSLAYADKAEFMANRADSRATGSRVRNRN